MKLVFSLGLVLSLSVAASCHLNPKYDYISLSAPITTTLKELNLLEDLSLKFISSFHPVEFKEEKKLYGGNFVSLKDVVKLKKPLVFFDESKSLEKIIIKNRLQYIKIKSRGMDPFVIVKDVLSKLKPFLLGCEKLVAKSESRLVRLREKILSELSSFPSKLIFFLGEIKNNKLPDLLIGNDGAVSFLNLYTDTLAYKTQIHYLPWSSKIIRKHERNSIFIGLSEGNLKIEKLTEKGRLNIRFPGVLAPGWSQIYFLSKLKSMIF